MYFSTTCNPVRMQPSASVACACAAWIRNSRRWCAFVFSDSRRKSRNVVCVMRDSAWMLSGVHWMTARSWRRMERGSSQGIPVRSSQRISNISGTPWRSQVPAESSRARRETSPISSGNAASRTVRVGRAVGVEECGYPTGDDQTFIQGFSPEGALSDKILRGRACVDEHVFRATNKLRDDGGARVRPGEKW